MEKNWKLSNLAKLHGIQDMMEGYNEIRGKQLPKPINDFFRDIERDLEILEILKRHIYFSTKSHCIRMKDIYKRTTNFDFENLKDWLENDQL